MHRQLLDSRGQEPDRAVRVCIDIEAEGWLITTSYPPTLHDSWGNPDTEWVVEVRHRAFDVLKVGLVLSTWSDLRERFQTCRRQWMAQATLVQRWWTGAAAVNRQAAMKAILIQTATELARGPTGYRRSLGDSSASSGGAAP